MMMMIGRLVIDTDYYSGLLLKGRKDTAVAVVVVVVAVAAVAAAVAVEI